MISMLCQKTNNGTITSTKNKDLVNFLILGEQSKKPIELIRKEATFDNTNSNSQSNNNNYTTPESASLLDLETIYLENKTEQNDIKLNKVSVSFTTSFVSNIS